MIFKGEYFVAKKYQSTDLVEKSKGKKIKIRCWKAIAFQHPQKLEYMLPIVMPIKNKPDPTRLLQLRSHDKGEPSHFCHQTDDWGRPSAPLRV